MKKKSSKDIWTGDGGILKYFYVFSARKNFFFFFDKIMIFRSSKSEREEIGVREITIFATMKIKYEDKLTDIRYV